MSASKKKNYLKGAAVLAFGGIVAKFLGMFLKLPLVRILGDFGMGLYGNAYPVYTFLLAISVIGLPVAISKMVSERISLGKYDGAYRVFKVAITTLALIGAVCTAIMIFGANFFISVFKWHPDTYYSILGLAFAPLCVCILSSFKGFFQGMQNMTPPSISQIVESITRVVVGLGLAVFLYKQFGVAFGAAGATFGATAGALVASLFLFLCFLKIRPRIKRQIKHQKTKSTEDVKTILKILAAIAIPITIASLVTSSMNLINSFTVSAFLQKAGFSVEEATILWGQLSQRAQTIISIPLILSSSLAASLVPTISESFVRKDTEQIRQKTFLTFKVVLMLALPCIAGLIVMASEVTTLLFGDANGANMLRLLSIGIVFTMISTTMQGILQGVGLLKVPVKNLAVGCVIKLILNVILIQIPALNIYGAILGTLGADFVVASLDYRAIKKFLGSTYKGLGMAFIKNLFCAAVMGIICFALKTFLAGFLSNSILTVIVIIVAIIVYFALIYFTKVLNIKEVRSVIGK